MNCCMNIDEARIEGNDALSDLSIIGDRRTYGCSDMNQVLAIGILNIFRKTLSFTFFQ